MKLPNVGPFVGGYSLDNPRDTALIVNARAVPRMLSRHKAALAELREAGTCAGTYVEERILNQREMIGNSTTSLLYMLTGSGRSCMRKSRPH
jgi:hypothetical protein